MSAQQIHGGNTQTETYTLIIELVRPFEVVPIPTGLPINHYYEMFDEDWGTQDSLELGTTRYSFFVTEWILEILDACARVMLEFEENKPSLTYTLQSSNSGEINVDITSDNPNFTKKFADMAARIFCPYTHEEFKLENIGGTRIIEKLIEIEEYKVLISIAGLLGIHVGIFTAGRILFEMEYPDLQVYFLLIFLSIGTAIFYGECKVILNLSEKRREKLKSVLHKLGEMKGISFVGLPKELCNTENKRKLFYGKKEDNLNTEDNDRASFLTIGLLILPFILSGTGGYYYIENYSVSMGTILIAIFGGAISGILLITYILKSYAIKTKITTFQEKQPVNGKITNVKPDDNGIQLFLRSRIIQK